jgi:hypothetical protein
LICEEFPAVTLPPSRKMAFSLDSRSSVVSGRGLVRVDRHGVALGLGNVDGHDLVVESARLGGGHRAAVRLERERVLVLARDAVALGDVLRRLAHRIRRVALGEAGVHEAPADGRVHEPAVAAREAPLRLQHHERRARHRLHAAGQHEAGLAEPDLAGGLHDRLEAGRAQPVHRHAGHLLGEPCDERCHPRHVPVVLAGLVRAAHVDLVHRLRVDVVALHRGGDRASG